MSLIPITQIKITKERWLNTQIQYEEDMYVRDIIDMLCIKVYNWTKSKNDFFLTMDYESFRDKFIQFMYEKYL